MSEIKEKLWVEYNGYDGPGNGKHVVFVSGDEEYRSEEALPMLAKILAVRHGFKCTVLFAIDPETGLIDPTVTDNIPGLHLLYEADMMVIFTRFRELPDDQMKPIVDFINSGKAILGIRTATHGFRYQKNPDSPYAKYSFRSTDPEGGFGRYVLGETWAGHHGHHGHESSRGVINVEMVDHPILRGVSDIWGPSDVYVVRDLPEDAQVLVFGQVLTGMSPHDSPNLEKNDPMMPMIWIRSFTGETGKTSRVLCSTIGAAVDLESEGLRRVLINGCYWGVGLEDEIPEKSNVDYVGEYKPTYFGMHKHIPNLRPSDYALR